MAVPGVILSPLVGVRPRAWSGACFTSAADVFDAFAVFAGSVISGFAAGGRTASRFGGSSGGVTACTGRPPIVVNPPLIGPSPPPASEIVMTSRASVRRPMRPRGAKRIAAASTPCAATDTVTIRWSPPGSCMRSRRMSLTSMSSSPFGQLRDHADVGDARGLQAIEHLHQLLKLHSAVAPEVDLLVGQVFDHLSNTL